MATREGNTMTNELLDAVDDLTLPRPVKVATDNGHTWAREDALLIQLREAVTSTLNSGSGAGGSPSTRNVLDSDALHRAGIITSAIGDWCALVDVKPTRDAVHDLRAWYVAYTNRDEPSEFYTRQMQTWAHQIRTMVNPPKSVEITAPCPVCGQGEYVNDMGERLTNPLVLTYRPDSGSIWSDARALCRACSEVWEGEWRLRELRHDVDDKETA